MTDKQVLEAAEVVASRWGAYPFEDGERRCIECDASGEIVHEGQCALGILLDATRARRLELWRCLDR